MSGTGNGASHPTERQPGDSRSLGDHGREIQHEAEALASAVRDTTDEVQRYLTEHVKQRPLTTLAVAAGVGYVLGGGLSARLTIALVGTATRLATAVAARELGTRILRRDSTSAQRQSI